MFTQNQTHQKTPGLKSCFKVNMAKSLSNSLNFSIKVLDSFHHFGKEFVMVPPVIDPLATIFLHIVSERIQKL